MSPHRLTVTQGQVSLAAPFGLSESILDVDDRIDLQSGGRLTVGDRVTLNTPALAIQGGATSLTQLSFATGATGSLGSVEVGGGGGVGQDASLTILDETEVGLDDLSIGDTSHTSVVSVVGGTLTQSPASIAAVGTAGGATALLAVTDGGLLQLGTGGVTVAGAGRILNSGSEVQFAGDVTLAAGGFSYRETVGSGATRSFAASSTLSVADGAQATFDAATLDLSAGQTLSLAGSGKVDAAGDFTLGTESRLHVTIDTSAASVDPSVSSAGEVTLGGVLDIELPTGQPAPAPGFQRTLIAAAGGFVGGFDNFLLPAVAGISWQVDVLPTSVELTAAEALPGDYNSDGLVNVADYTVWRDSLDSTSALFADGDGNGRIEIADYNLWRQAMLPPPAAVALAPEPAGMTLLLLAMATANRARRPRWLACSITHGRLALQ
ncbi:MAG: hypothetical protein AAGF31_10990 [Planctomycetota bacterium]